MAEIPTREPAQIRAGDTIKWRREDLSLDYPATLWTLKYYLLKSDKQIVITATASGDLFAVTISKTSSAAYTAGLYSWIAKVSKGTTPNIEEYTVDQGTITVLPDLTTQTTGYDTRSYNRKMLDIIRELLAGRIPKDVNDYQFGDKRVIRMSPPELLQLEATFARRVQIENARTRRKQGLQDGFSAKMRF